MTAAPGRLGTGAASPVSMASSACDCPASTSPSTGSRAPGSTWQRAVGQLTQLPYPNPIKGTPFACGRTLFTDIRPTPGTHRHMNIDALPELRSTSRPLTPLFPAAAH